MESNKRITAIIAFALLLLSSIIAKSQSDDLTSLRSRAYNGEVQAMIELSQYYQSKGNGSLAEEWLKKAEKTSPGSTANTKKALEIDKELSKTDRKVGKLSKTSSSYQEEVMSILNTYLKYVESNNVHSIVGIAYLYEKGYGVELDKAEAERQYRKAISIDPKNAFRYMDPYGSVALSILKEYANGGNTDVMIKLADHYSHIEDGKSEAQKWYKLAADKGDAEAKNKYERVCAEIDYDKKESARLAKEKAEENANYQETLKNFAGVWKHKNNRMQYKFNSKGEGWARARRSTHHYWSEWDVIGVKYVGYNKIRVYYEGSTCVLEVSLNRMRQIPLDYEYYKQ